MLNRLDPPTLLAVMAGLSVLMAGLAVAAIYLRRDPVYRRLKAMQAEDGHGKAGDSGLKAMFVGLLSRLAESTKPKQSWQVSKIRKDLLAAGFRSTTSVNVFLGLRIVALLLPPVLLLLSGLPARYAMPIPILILVGAAGIGYLIPGMVLNNRTAKRRKEISRELPSALDLLVISVEAGLGLDSALKRVGREMKISGPVLADELNMVSLELKAGIPRAQALKNLGMRCNLDDVSSLVSMLNQADRFGVSVGRSLRVHADTVRTKRRQRAEEMAAKVPLKLLFPVLFMIFPAIMIVMAGPAIIKVGESMIK